MKIILFAFVFTFISLSCIAQINHGGQPYDWNKRGAVIPEMIILPQVDIKKLANEDSVSDQHKDIPYRFGANIPVDIDINNSGTWTTLENGDRVWEVGIKSAGAVSINFVFDEYYLPEGGKVFVYDSQKKQLLGSFTNENANNENALGVGFIFSDEIIISYHEPAVVAGLGYLHINNVTHGYRNAIAKVKSAEKAGPFGNSAGCNVNVNCPQGLPYDNQKRSVALIVVNNNGICTGALMNNTSQDGAPLFLTANHCNGNPGNWIFYFNHETPDCEGNGTAPTNQSISGATLKANNEESDFKLLLLNDDIPTSFNACFSGWDATDNANNVSSAYGIHHPAGDIKKICFEDNAPYKATLAGFANQVWYIDNWELGVTQLGSSGSPLFNQSGLIIGQLAGGAAACDGPVNNGLYDFYGRLGVSWDFGSTPDTRLKEWLDPGNTGQLIVQNSGSSQNINNDATLVSINGIDNPSCTLSGMQASVNVINTGMVSMTNITLSLEINGVSQPVIFWTGNVESFTSVSIPLGIVSPQEGGNEVEVSILTVNGVPDEQDTGNIISWNYEAFSATQTISIEIVFDDYPDETSWRLENDQGTTLISGLGSEGQLTIDENICIGIGCYTFVIDDFIGDGICCQYGIGSYTVTDEYGLVVASGGNFSYFEETEFCINTVGVKRTILESINIYPNPTRNLSRVEFGEVANSVNSLVISDALGRVLISETNAVKNVSNYELDGSLFSEGVYFISIDTDFGTTTKRIVVVK